MSFKEAEVNEYNIVMEMTNSTVVLNMSQRKKSDAYQSELH